MALSDSILLQISQKKTSYNDLLTKMLSNYSSSGSAKAALSRALKNLIAFGELKKQDDNYVLTDKGKVTVESKLKNKILININELLDKSRRTSSLEHADDIIKNIQIFIERSKTDPSLLKIGKTGSNFYISDLEFLKKEIDNSVSHYTHLSEVLKNQINILEEQNFEDVLIINLNKSSFNYIKFLLKNTDIKELSLECAKEYPETIKLLESISYITKKNEFIYKLKINDLSKLEKHLINNFETAIQVRFKVYINEILVRFSFGKIYFFGPYNIISKIRSKKEEKK